MAEKDKIKNNIGRLFYKDYYEEVDFNKVLFGNADKDNDLQIDKTIKNSPLVKIEKPVKDVVSIFATVQYPGLVTGVGLSHDAKVGYKLGMHFDYTHGMPIVYGSSVKGVLRTYFEDFFLKNQDNKDDVKSLLELIFEGKNPEYDEKKDTPRYIPIYERDVFFDAVIIKEYKGRFLVDDSITPHTEGPLKNPIPIKMLKIAPGCKMEFRFKLNNHKIKDREYTSDFILEIFKNILGTVGVGAKTNVGYGQLKIEE